MELQTLVHWVAPPVVGAFIGYLTNRVAIRMLFRPLTAWRVFGVRVPMTPGVIPAKRHQLADNMGEVVGEHLLTSDELARALATDEFRRRLQELIQERLSGFLDRDLGPLPQLLPAQLQMFLPLALIGLSGRLKGLLSDFLGSDAIRQQVEEAVRLRLQKMLESEAAGIMTPHRQKALQAALAQGLTTLFTDDQFSQLLRDFICDRVDQLCSSDASPGELLPTESLDFVVEILVQPLSDLGESSALVLRDRTLLDQLVSGIIGGVDRFIDSLGSASEVVRNFVKMDLVEYQLRRLLTEHQQEIGAWLNSTVVRSRLEKVVRSRLETLFRVPLKNLTAGGGAETAARLGEQISDHLVAALCDERAADSIAAVVASFLDRTAEQRSVGELFAELAGGDRVARVEEQLVASIMTLLDSEEVHAALGGVIDSLLGALREKPLGRLGRFIPPMVVGSVAEAVQGGVTTILGKELPGLVETLGIRRIITRKINSLDLLRLEKLLLSIMEEQFKYINLFGALLGFLIGCLNLFFLRL